MEQLVVVTNRKAFHQYHILDKYEAGMELLGSEVKSLREGNCNLSQAYIIIRKGQAWLSGVHIKPYSHTGFDGHESVRNRKLLLHNREIIKLKTKLDQKGLTAIPLKIYFNKKGLAKLELALAKGKKNYDKKIALKERDIKRESERELSERRK